MTDAIISYVVTDEDYPAGWTAFLIRAHRAQERRERRRERMEKGKRTETPSAPASDGKVFRVEGFGEVGEANLAGFIPHPGHKLYQDLELNEMTIGTAHMCGTSDVIRLWRVR